MLSLGLSICSPAVWGNGAFVPSNAETATLIAALTGTYQKSLKQAWDDAIGELKTSGAWADFDVLYPIGAIPGADSTNADDSRLNWKNPGTFSAAAVNSPTHGSGYWQGDGSSSRLRTQYTPATHGVKFTQDDASEWVWSITDSQESISCIGGASSPSAYIVPRNGSNNLLASLNMSAAQAAVSAQASSIGLFGAQRSGATDLRSWHNGVQKGTSSNASTGRSAQEQWICGANSNQFSTKRVIFAAWGAKQEGREASIYSTLQTLFTAAGTI
jgi:hypothetical protein